MTTRLMNICSWPSRGRFRICVAWAVLLGTSWVTVLTPVTAWAGSSEQPSQNEPATGSSWNPLTWQWVPTKEEILKYRNGWNPMSNGPILSTSVDLNPKGQFHMQYFVFGEMGHQQFGNTLTTH